jgi:hypothetical protein
LSPSSAVVSTILLGIWRLFFIRIPRLFGAKTSTIVKPDHVILENMLQPNQYYWRTHPPLLFKLRVIVTRPFLLSPNTVLLENTPFCCNQTQSYCYTPIPVVAKHSIVGEHTLLFYSNSELLLHAHSCCRQTQYYWRTPPSVVIKSRVIVTRPFLL